MFRTAFLILLVLAGPAGAAAQKVRDARDDSWLGTVSSVDASTREIRLAPLRGKDEPFVGLLDEGFRAQLLDGSISQPQVSEIPVGMRVRVYYKTRREEVGGKKVKVNRVFAVAFQGRDDYDRLRVRLGLAPSTAVTVAGWEAFPPSNPLRLHVYSERPLTKGEVAKWVEKWNGGEAARHGAVEVVDDLARADVALVIYASATEFTPPIELPEGDLEVLPTVTVFLVVPKAGGLEVLWRYRPFASSPSGAGPVGGILKQLEKRLKARSQAQGKS